MKRHFNLLASVLLVIAMVFALASCDLIDKIIPGKDQPEPEHQHAFVDGSCECGEADPNYVAPHEHNFVEGKCECGETDPNYTKPECAEHAYGAPEVTKEATCTESGSKTLTCTVCGYATELEIAPTGHEETKVPGYDPTCTAAGLSDGKVCSVCETVTVEQVEINAIGHSFVEGVCGNCGDVDPNYNGPKTYVLDAQTLTAFAAGTKADGDTELVADFFTIYYSAKTKIDTTKNKTWSDGYTFAEGLRINWGGATAIGETTKNAIEIVVDGTATVKVWWICGGDGREIGIYNENGTLVVSSETNDVFAESEGVGAGKNGVYLSELSLDASGKYYIGTDCTKATKDGGNYICKVEVTVTPAEGGSNTPALNGQGTMDEPFVLPEAGDYVAAFPGGYDLIYYTYTTSVNGYVTLSSNWNGAAWLKIGTDIYNLAGNDGNGSVKVFALAGTPVYFGVADWDEKANDIPFTVSVEEVTLGSVENYVGAWKGEFSSFWGTTTLIFEINADGTGTAVEKGGWSDVNYTLSAIVVGDVAIVTIVDEYGNPTEYTFSLNEDGTITVESTYLSGTLTTYDPNEQPPVNPDVNYETVIVIGGNTLYFSAEEIAADAASRTANITLAGNYKFVSGNLFVASVVDANGNTLTKNDDYSYTLAEGEYTVNFGMLSMFGVSADSACTLNVEAVSSGDDIGGGDVGGGDEYPEFVTDELKEAVLGWYDFEGYSIGIYQSFDDGCYLANVYGEGFDLYFTFDVTANADGSYSIALTYFARPDMESGTDKIDTVLGYNIVIGGSSDEPAVPGDVIDINTLPGTGTSADPYIITESGSYLLTNVNAYPGYLVSFGSDVEITVTVKADVAELYAKNWSKFADENVEYTFTVAAGETLPMWVVMESGTAPEVILTVEISTEGGNGGSEGGDDIGGDVGGEDPVDPAPAGVVYVGWDSWGANPLKVVVADTTITFIYSHPMRGDQVYVYTYIVSDGEIVLYDETGAAVNPLAAQVGVDANGTPVSAVYNGTSYTLLPEGQEPSFPEECYHYSTSMNETAPSCTATGLFTVTCDDCGEVLYTETLDMIEHDYDHVVTAPTCTAAGYTTHTCAFCDYSYTDSETEALGHADENEDYKCDKCSTKMLPADGTALTIPQAIAVAKVAGTSYSTQKYYITGIVTGLYNTQYGNFYIKDAEGNEICIYGLYSYDGSTRYDAMSYKPVNGDEVTVYTVLGLYNSTSQGKNAWLDEVVAHEHNYVDSVKEPTCTASGNTTHTCSICGDAKVDTEVAALGHTTDNGTCERCGLTFGGDEPVIGTLATFDFGANGSATHTDPNSKFSNGKSYTVDGYTLKFTSATNCYDGGRDAKGNSCMKMGTSSNTGSFTVTVADDVTEVVIYVAQYKANTTKVSVNGGTAQTITTASNNGAYTAIVIDTSVNKTFTFATVSGGVRCMIDKIEFNGVVG